MAFYVGKALQLAGLVGVAFALLVGLVRGDHCGVMAQELGGAAFGMLVFYVGRLIESR